MTDKWQLTLERPDGNRVRINLDAQTKRDAIALAHFRHPGCTIKTVARAA